MPTSRRSTNVSHGSGAKGCNPLPESFRDRRVTLMGLGRFGGGAAAAEYLSNQGAHLVITDLRPEEALVESIQQLKDRGVDATWYLGGHPDDAFENCDCLVVNPGVRPDNSLVERCRHEGVVITSEIELFVRRNPAQTIAVTGSNGKSTVCRLICDLLLSGTGPHRRVLLGGNIGHSLLSSIDSIDENDITILELSSFQLHLLRDCGFCPDVAVVTGVTPNHLDWHPDLKHYTASKQVISATQSVTGTIVLPDALDDWPVRGQCLRFGSSDSGEDGVFVEHGSLIVRRGDHEIAERVRLPPALRGEHNSRNLAAAVAAVVAATDDQQDVQSTIRRFRGLPHRMQVVTQGAGRMFIDDSCSTTPESTIAALKSLLSPCVLMVGGGDKGVDLTILAAEIARTTDRVVTMGATARSLAAAVLSVATGEPGPQVIPADDFEDAFRQAVELTQPGDMVLLSPGCTSHDWFADFRERGHTFARLARQWCEAQEENG